MRMDLPPVLCRGSSDRVVPDSISGTGAESRRPRRTAELAQSPESRAMDRTGTPWADDHACGPLLHTLAISHWQHRLGPCPPRRPAVFQRPGEARPDGIPSIPHDRTAWLFIAERRWRRCGVTSQLDSRSRRAVTAEEPRERTRVDQPRVAAPPVASRLLRLVRHVVVGVWCRAAGPAVRSVSFVDRIFRSHRWSRPAASDLPGSVFVCQYVLFTRPRSTFSDLSVSRYFLFFFSRARRVLAREIALGRGHTTPRCSHSAAARRGGAVPSLECTDAFEWPLYFSVFMHNQYAHAANMPRASPAPDISCTHMHTKYSTLCGRRIYSSQRMYASSCLRRDDVDPPVAGVPEGVRPWIDHP